MISEEAQMEKVAHLERKIDRLEQSVSLRLGSHIVKSVRHPWRAPFLIFTLPWQMLLVGFEILRKRSTSDSDPVVEISDGSQKKLERIEEAPDKPVKPKGKPILPLTVSELKPHFCDESRHRFEYQLMKQVHRFFQSRNIAYWAIGGTLLGQVKYAGIIPWDHDIDLFTEMLPQSVEQELMDEMSAIDGCSVRRWLWDGRRPGIQIHDTRGSFKIAIDIFYAYFHEGTFYSLGANIHKFPEQGRQGIDRIINPGLRNVDFGSVAICVPSPEATQEYLDWKFGDNWMDEYVIFNFVDKTSIRFPANPEMDAELTNFVLNRSSI